MSLKGSTKYSKTNKKISSSVLMYFTNNPSKFIDYEHNITVVVSSVRSDVRDKKSIILSWGKARRRDSLLGTN